MSDLDPDKSRPDPQHWVGIDATTFIYANMYHMNYYTDPRSGSGNLYMDPNPDPGENKNSNLIFLPKN